MILNQEMLYKDITDELIKMATPNDNPIPEISRYLKYNLKNASFDMKDITDIERITLKQIQNKIGGQFNMIHIEFKKKVYEHRMLNIIINYYIQIKDIMM